MQLRAEYALRGFRAQCVFGKNRRAGKTELIKFFKLFLQIFLRFAKLGAVAFVKNKHHLLLINRQALFTFHQVIELLDGGNNNFIVVFFQIALQPRRAVRTVDTIRRKPLIFLHRLIIEVFAVDHKKHFIDKFQPGGQTRRLEAG